MVQTRRVRRPRVLPVLTAVLVLVALPAAPAGAAKEPKPTKRASVYRTKGYKGLRVAPKVGPEAAPATVPLGTGVGPDVHIDAAGTAHIVWTEPGAVAPKSDTTHYCRIPRGANACDNPNPTPFTGVPAESSGEFGKARILQIGDGLVAISQRYAASVVHPDGQPSSSTTYAWTSDDGGQTWSPPAILGTTGPSGEAVVLGGPLPRIAVITDAVTGGTSVQIFPSGAYLRGGILLGPNAPNNGTIADDGGGVPIAAFTDLNDVTTVRRWTGSGSVQDPSSWSTATFPGSEPRLAGGPRGTQLMHREAGATPRAWTVRPVTGGQPGAPQNLSGADTPAGNDAELLQDASGRLRALWTTGFAPERILSRVAEPGQGFSGAELVNLGRDQITNLEAATAQDGGGGVVFERSDTNTIRDLRFAAFGPLSPTGKPGAGSRAGGGIPNAIAGCSAVTFGKIIVKPRGGCLFPATEPQYQGAGISEGEVDLGGLAVVPDPNVKIVIDPRRQRFDTTGTVRVILRGGGLPDLTIFKGELHLDFKASGSGLGATLLDLDAAGLDLGGFPIVGRIQVFLTEDGARIPLSLRLPPALGGISGDATLVLRRGSGVSVESARISADVVPIGPVAIEDLDIRYAGGDWSGSAVLALPPRPGGIKFGADVVFRDGNFKEGRLSLTLPFPGVLIGPNVYFAQFRGGFGVDPITITAGATVGAFPLAPPLYTVDVAGDLTVSFAKEVVFQLDASARVLTLGVANAKAKITTAGYGEATGRAGINLSFLRVDGSVSLAFDGPRGRFAGEFSGDVVLEGVTLAGGAGSVSNTGVAVCGEALGSSAGVFLAADGDTEFFGDIGEDCDLSPYRGPPVARQAQAGPATVSVPGGARSASIEVRATGGAPGVVLIAPGGRRVTPVQLGDPASRGAEAVTYAVPEKGVRVIALRRPAKGAWQVEQAGGSPIAGARIAVPAAPVRVTGSVRRAGTGRVLAYRATGVGNGTTVRVFERGGGIARPLGVLRNGTGTLRLRAGEGRGGPRTIVGLVERRSPVSRPQITIARYTAPGARAPGPPRRATAALRRGTLTVTWSAATGAQGHRVRVTLRDGRVLVRDVRGRSRTLTVRRLGSEARLRSVTVAGTLRAGLTGPAAPARVR